jgi:hypothetical protein
MKAALLAIALMLGFAGPVATDSAAPRQDGAAPRLAPAERPDGALVLAVLSPERVVVADPRTGRTREREFPGGTLCHGPLVVAGGRVVHFGLDGRRVAARASRLDRLGDDGPIGAADTAVPSATPGRLWLGTRHGSQVDLREVDAKGVVHTYASTPIGRWDRVLAQVGSEFVTTSDTGLVLGRERFDGAWFVAAHGDRLAYCGDPCRRVGIWSAGRSGVLVPPPGMLAHREGAFSPDGTQLALAVTVAGKPRFAVVDVARNQWRIVPSARPGDYAAVAWSPSGRWLYMADGSDRLLAARDGTGRPRRLPIRTGGTVMTIASTPGSAAR